MNKTNIKAVLQVISACTKIRQLQELYARYKHIPVLEDAMIDRKDYILYGVKEMKLGSGMEAWPSSRIGDRTHCIGRVSHIRPTSPKPQPKKETNHGKQAAKPHAV